MLLVTYFLFTASNAPTISGITAVGSDRFTVNWDYTNPGASLQQATEYRVTYSDGSGSNTTEPVANIDTKMLQITGLTSNTDYSVTVLAWKDDVISTDDSALSLVASECCYFSCYLAVLRMPDYRDAFTRNAT